jgi:hypothetical protein
MAFGTYLGPVCASYFAKIEAQVSWVHVSSIFPFSSSGFQMFHALAESVTGYFEAAEVSCYQSPR